MRLALLKGNRFNPWHLEAFKYLGNGVNITMFRADSEIQRRFDNRGSLELPFEAERIYFDTESGNPVTRLVRALQSRYGKREPRIVPFHERLRDFDLIQSWELFTDWSAEAVAAKERYGIPLVVMVWDNIPFNMERSPERRRMKERVAQSADKFLVHTERSRRMLDIEGVPLERIVKFDPGIDLEVFAPGPADRSMFGVDDADFVILFVGWLLPRKGIDFLVLALRELVNDPELEGVNIRLVMVGAGPGKDRVEQLIHRLGIERTCKFAGALPYDQMPAAYRAADVFAMPSIPTVDWQEQFGMALIEAIAAGVPVIGSLSGAIPEIANEAAILCQPSDFLAFYEALKHLILEPDERRRLSEAGRKRALERFDVRSSAEKLSAVYSELLDKR